MITSQSTSHHDPTSTPRYQKIITRNPEFQRHIANTGGCLQSKSSKEDGGKSTEGGTELSGGTLVVGNGRLALERSNWGIRPRRASSGGGSRSSISPSRASGGSRGDAVVGPGVSVGNGSGAVVSPAGAGSINRGIGPGVAGIGGISPLASSSWRWGITPGLGGIRWCVSPAGGSGALDSDGAAQVIVVPDRVGVGRGRGGLGLGAGAVLIVVDDGDAARVLPGLGSIITRVLPALISGASNGELGRLERLASLLLELNGVLLVALGDGDSPVELAGASLTLCAVIRSRTRH
jgi:hypothetical protein